MNIVLLIINSFMRIDTVKAAVVSLLSTLFGSSLAAITQGAPEWFASVSPWLQCIAWIVGIMAGIVTIILTIIKIRKAR